MKRKIGSMTVKRAIISAMVAMLVVSSPMTAMASGLDVSAKFWGGGASPL